MVQRFGRVAGLAGRLGASRWRAPPGSPWPCKSASSSVPPSVASLNLPDIVSSRRLFVISALLGAAANAGFAFLATGLPSRDCAALPDRLLPRRRLPARHEAGRHLDAAAPWPRHRPRRGRADRRVGCPASRAVADDDKPGLHPLGPNRMVQPWRSGRSPGPT